MKKIAMFLSLGILLTILAAAVPAHAGYTVTPPQGLVVPKSIKTIAVLPFNDKRSDKKEVPDKLADIIEAKLTNLLANKFFIVERTDIDKVMAEHGLAMSGLANPAKAVQFGKLVGANGLLVGDIIELRKPIPPNVKIEITCRLIDVEEAAIIGSVTIKGEESNWTYPLNLTEDIIGKGTENLAAAINPEGSGFKAVSSGEIKEAAAPSVSVPITVTTGTSAVPTTAAPTTAAPPGTPTVTAPPTLPEVKAPEVKAPETKPDLPKAEEKKPEATKTPTAEAPKKEEPGIISGKVIDPNDNPIASANVETENIKVASDPQGIFKLEGLKAGTYKITVSKTDFETATKEGVAVKAGETVSAGDITLKPVRKAAYKFVKSWGSWGTANGQFEQAEGIAIHRTGGMLYVADELNNRVQSFDLDGKFRHSIPVPGIPWGVAVAPNGTIYITNCSLNTVQAYPGNKEFKTNLSGIRGIATDSAGNIYVVSMSNVIKKFSPTGTTLATWNLSGRAGMLHGIVIDAAGNALVTDRDKLVVLKLSPSGTFLGNIGGPNVFKRSMNNLTLDAQGNLYVTDYGVGFHKFDPAGNLVVSFGRATGEDAGIAPETFINPSGIVVDNQGNVYVSERSDNSVKNKGHRVQKFVPVK